MNNILGRLYYVITGDTTALERNLSSSRKEIQALGVQLNETGRSILSFAKGAVTAVLIKSLTEAASRADELQNKFNTVFGGISAETESWAESYSEATNRGRIETMEFLAAQQDIRTGFGDTAKSAAEFSKAVVGITNDLASFSNIPVSEAIAAVNSGLNGEFEALRRLGVGLNVAIINQLDYAESIGKTWDEMDNLERQEAILSGIVTQSANALHQNITMWQDYDYTLGDAALTYRSFANQMQGFMGTLTDFKAEIGDELIPIASLLLGGITDLMHGFNELDDSMQTMIVSAAAAGAAWLAIGGPLGIAAAAVTGLAVGLSNIKTPAEKLSDSIAELTEATDDYRASMKQLSDESDTLTSKQRELLEIEAELAKTRAQNKLRDVAENYRTQSKSIESSFDTYMDWKARYDAVTMAMTSSVEDMYSEITRLERKGLENLSTYEESLLYSLQERLDDSLKPAHLQKIKQEISETTDNFKEIWLEAVQEQEESIRQLAVLFNEGALDLSDYEKAYPELCQEVRTTAAELKSAEEAIDDTAESTEKAATATRKWRDALREQNAELLDESGAYKESYRLKVEMLRDEQEEALRQLAVDSAVIQSGENASELTIEELRKRLSANSETNSEMLAQDQYYANESMRLWEEYWRKTHSGKNEDDTETSDLETETESTYERMLKRQKAAAENAAAAELERNGDYEAALEIRKKLIEEERDLAIQSAKAKISAGEASVEEIEKINEYYDQEIIQAEEESAEKEIKAQKRKAEEIKDINREMFSSILSFASDFSSSIGDVYSSITERRLQQIDDETDATLEALGLQEDTELEKLQKEYTEAVKNGDMELAQEKEREIQRQRIREEAEERKKKLQREEAERSKALAIFQATIDTLASVIGFMNDPGGWAGIAMSTMAAATGAAQIAAIAAEPLPSYAVGAVDINEDQIAQLHQGELVIPKTFAEGIRDGDISIGRSESKVEVTIINNTGTAATADRMDDGDITRLRITIGETVASEISKGRLDSAMMQRFSITRRNQRG